MDYPWSVPPIDQTVLNSPSPPDKDFLPVAGLRCRCESLDYTGRRRGSREVGLEGGVSGRPWFVPPDTRRTRGSRDGVPVLRQRTDPVVEEDG